MLNLMKTSSASTSAKIRKYTFRLRAEGAPVISVNENGWKSIVAWEDAFEVVTVTARSLSEAAALAANKGNPNFLCSADLEKFGSTVTHLYLNRDCTGIGECVGDHVPPHCTVVPKVFGDLPRPCIDELYSRYFPSE